MSLRSKQDCFCFPFLFADMHRQHASLWSNTQDWGRRKYTSEQSLRSNSITIQIELCHSQEKFNLGLARIALDERQRTKKGSVDISLGLWIQTVKLQRQDTHISIREHGPKMSRGNNAVGCFLFRLFWKPVYWSITFLPCSKRSSPVMLSSQRICFGFSRHVSGEVKGHDFWHQVVKDLWTSWEADPSHAAAAHSLIASR